MIAICQKYKARTSIENSAIPFLHKNHQSLKNLAGNKLSKTHFQNVIFSKIAFCDIL